MQSTGLRSYCSWARGGLFDYLRLSNVASAMLEDVGLTIYREDHRTLVGMGLVGRANSAPDEFSGAAYSIMVVERALKDECLFNFGMRVHRERRARLPLEEASHLPLLFVLVKDLDGDAFELGWLPGHVLRFEVS